jgi:DNA polymerase I
MSTKKKLFLLDAYALIYRSYYAFIRNPRFNSKGMNTSAIFGFVNTLEEILKKEKPTHIAVVFDPPFPTFRNEMYTEYKANREETPEDIRKSVPIIKQIIEAYNIPILEVPGFEADDVVGTTAALAEKNGFVTYMMTPDKDFCQLVTEKILIYKPTRSGNEAEVWGIDEVKKNFQVSEPSQVIDVLGLWGDASDNVPGAPGIGEVTSKKLIGEFGSIEKLYENLEKLKPKVQEILLNNKEKIELSKKLVTIKQDVPLKVDFDSLRSREINAEAIKALFEELEFKTLMQRIIPNGTAPRENAIQGMLFGSETAEQEIETTREESYKNLATIENTKHDYRIVQTAEGRKSLISRLSGQKSFCFDTETSGLEVHTSTLVGLSFCFQPQEAWYVPVPDDFPEAKALLEEFRPVMENANIEKVGQNIKFDILALKKYGIKVNGPLFDTMLAHYLLQPDLRHNLNYLAEIYLGYQPVSIEELIGKKGKNQMNMRDVDLEKVKEYAAEDADITWQLKERLEKELQENKLIKLFQEIEMPLINVLAEMEWAGIRIDSNILETYAVELNAEADKIEKEIFDMAGMQFNLQSPKQLGEVLFEKMKIISNPSRTKTKQYSTGEDVLEKIADKHPIIAKILDYRGLKKLVSTYVEALPKLVNSETGKIHTSFNQAIASTGRLSSTNPNLQNIPIREERGREIRKAFVPSDDKHILLAADYSQIELRLMAHMSGDEAMIEAFRNSEDIHAATAAKIHGLKQDEVTREMRSQAKTANFGIIYGISAFGLSQRLNISREEAKKLIDGYFATYPGVKAYMDKNIHLARENGFVETIMGRKRSLSDINSRNAIVRGMAERNAINAPIQGSAADIIKLAMIRIRNRFEKENIHSKLVLQVHDELVFDLLKIELEAVKKIAREEMENAVSLSVPLTVDLGTGENWLEAH